ncbi:MAG: ADP-ribosylglycohydrolase family protein [Oscillospiraceae bacterium]|nr:ADP-ribosylglycohydrolase family protein [Oscillospiraceae bacterium]
MGVFYGRPIEGWPYEKIKSVFGDVDHYVYNEAHTPLIVADDDLSGTFTFFNTIEDSKNIEKLMPQDFGETWLNYIIEDKTIFWWGGLGRSTEHTAYIRLKQGLKAPHSGSIKTNGCAVAEQIGAQIFIDAFAMMCPNDPEKTRHFIKQAAEVSHDGIAVESACFIGALEALAFGERDINKLLDEALRYSKSDKMNEIMSNVREECLKNTDWRIVREWLDKRYGYNLYPGNCHVVPNLSLILSSLILGGDSFQKAMNIVVSSGWDTDCNGANLGCINGIRLGLSEINKEFDFRKPIADRFYNISSDGGSCVTDAVIQTRRIVFQHNRLVSLQNNKKGNRFAFEFEGSLQGFCECPVLGGSSITNGNTSGYGDGILIAACQGGTTSASTPTMWDPKDYQGNYCLIGSPILYSGQTVCAKVKNIVGEPKARLYVVYYDFNDNQKVEFGSTVKITEECSLQWRIPDLGGMTISRLGIQCLADEPDKSSQVLLMSVNWDGAPESFEIKGSLRNYDITGFNMQMNGFTSSAKQFSFDSCKTFTVSNIEKNGIVTTGTAEWKDYTVASELTPGIHDRFGLVARAKGHRRYYGAVLWGSNRLGIIKKVGEAETLLASTEYIYEINKSIALSFSCIGSQLTVSVDEKTILQVNDDEYSCGGAGYLIDCGTCLADGFNINGK